MRSKQEQIAGLAIIAEKLREQVCNCMIDSSVPGDVAILYAPVPNASQIVYADETHGSSYDVWDSKGKKILRPDVSADEAVKIVAAEYKANKIDIVMTRVVGKDWRQKTDERTARILRHVEAQVWDNALQKLYSNASRPMGQ